MLRIKANTISTVILNAHIKYKLHFLKGNKIFTRTIFIEAPNFLRIGLMVRNSSECVE